MKRVFTLSLGIVLAITTSFATSLSIPVSTVAVTSSPAPEAAAAVKATDMRIPIGSTGKFINLQDLSTIKVADFEQLTGKKMGLLRRMEFKMAQRNIRHSINNDGTVNNKRLAKMAKGYGEDDGSFHFGGFALGFFLGLIGVLIAYLINDDLHHRRVKWAWLGFAIYVGVLLIVIAASA
jgi:hypothetical protein